MKKEYIDIIECVSRVILFPETRALMVYENNDKMNRARTITSDLIDAECGNEVEDIAEYTINFKNGSTIEFVTPNPRQDVIRGKGASIDYMLYDWKDYDGITDALDGIVSSKP